MDRLVKLANENEEERGLNRAVGGATGLVGAGAGLLGGLIGGEEAGRAIGENIPNRPALAANAERFSDQKGKLLDSIKTNDYLQRDYASQLSEGDFDTSELVKARSHVDKRLRNLDRELESLKYREPEKFKELQPERKRLAQLRGSADAEIRRKSLGEHSLSHAELHARSRKDDALRRLRMLYKDQKSNPLDFTRVSQGGNIGAAIGAGAGLLGGAVGAGYLGSKAVDALRRDKEASMSLVNVDKVEKLANSGDSTITQDFLGGLDPTGVKTFNNATQNEENHKRHQLVGNAGGFASGALIGSLVPAGLMGATSKAVGSKNPVLAKEFSNMAKGSVEALNPAKMKKYFGSLKDLSKYKRKGSEVIRDSNALGEMAEKPGRMIVNPRNMREAKSSAKRLQGNQNELKTLGGQISQKYFDGQTVGDGGSRAFSAISTAGSAAIGGATSATAANMQYNQGRNVRERLDEANDLTKAASDYNKKEERSMYGLAKLSSDERDAAREELLNTMLEYQDKVDELDHEMQRIDEDIPEEAHRKADRALFGTGALGGLAGGLLGGAVGKKVKAPVLLGAGGTVAGAAGGLLGGAKRSMNVIEKNSPGFMDRYRDIWDRKSALDDEYEKRLERLTGAVSAMDGGLLRAANRSTNVV